MTADEWSLADDWAAMLSQLPGIDGGRRLRLWAVGMCRHILGHHANDPISPGRYDHIFNNLAPSVGVVLNAAELFADGQLVWRELRATKPISGGPYNIFHTPARKSHLTVAYLSVDWRLFIGEFGVPTPRNAADLLRDIFGNPFRPVLFDPRWRSESAVSLARTAYDTRNFTLMPILADALEEAGCDHPGVLTHCRDPQQVHVRGCWVLDGVLGQV